jgi:hypothetical protein
LRLTLVVVAGHFKSALRPPPPLPPTPLQRTRRRSATLPPLTDQHLLPCFARPRKTLLLQNTETPISQTPKRSQSKTCASASPRRPQRRRRSNLKHHHQTTRRHAAPSGRA